MSLLMLKFALGDHAVWILGVCRPGECHVNLPFPVSGLLLWIYA